MRMREFSYWVCDSIEMAKRVCVEAIKSWEEMMRGKVKVSNAGIECLLHKMVPRLSKQMGGQFVREFMLTRYWRLRL